MTTPTMLTLGLWVLASPLAAQTIWKPLPTTGGPGPLRFAAVAYDGARDAVLFFGGGSSFGAASAETWSWDGSSWTRHQTAHAPPARYYASMEYDAVRRQVVLFGGTEPASLGGDQLADTWLWDGQDWTRARSPSSPRGREGTEMVFDAGRQRIVLFGGSVDGRLGEAQSLGDTWEWDGSRWAHQIVPGQGPGARDGHGMVWDSIRERIVVAGGFIRGTTILNPIPATGTWEYDGQAWRAGGGRPPTTRGLIDMVHDRARGRTVYFDGSAAWERLEDGWIARAVGASPVDAGGGTAVYDTTRDRVLFWDSQQFWTYGAETPAVYDSFGTGCAGAGPALRLSRSTIGPWLGDTFELVADGVPTGSAVCLAAGASDTAFGGLALPYDLGAIGMPGCALYVGLDAFAAGSTPSEGRSRWTLSISANPLFIGTEFHVQAFATDSSAGPLGMIASDAGTATIGVK